MITEISETIMLHLAEENIPDHLKSILLSRLKNLAINAELVQARETLKEYGNFFVTIPEPTGGKITSVDYLVEQIIQQIPFDFETLPLLVEGESKIVRMLNSKIVVEQFKPTIYSYTHNRYGVAEKTDDLRVLFTSEVFRRMRAYSNKTGKNLRNAFLACSEQSGRLFLIQEKMRTSNLEVRVKRFHVGSPIHRYKFTEHYRTVQNNGKPLQKWSRFDNPVVCFDWRHPLTDEEGNRLADEPISDDYASIWIKDITGAKLLASEVFLWLEELFQNSKLILVDICFFINEKGESIFGEISPDCFRVREGLENEAKSYDKDVWRKGGTPEEISERYESLYNLIFNT